MIKVLIADDHLRVRRGLKQLCEMMGDVCVAGEAGDGDEVLQVLQEAHYDLLLLDLSMPGLSGIELVRHARARSAKVPILVLSMHTEVPIVERAIRAGAAGFVGKGGDNETLMDAIRSVAAGGHYVDPVIAQHLMFDQTAVA